MALRIEDHAMIGDCETAALVGSRRLHRLVVLASLRLGCVFLGTLGPAVRVRGMLGRFEECAECERK
jgi:hypothetical protein